MKFIPESKKKSLGNEVFYNTVRDRTNYYTKDIYATQTWKRSYEGDGPFYQLAFMMIKEAPTHDRTWSQQMIFPVELTLQTINDEVRLCRNPIDGIKQLRYDSRFWKNTLMKPGEDPFREIKGDVFEIISEFEIGNAKEIVFNIRGEKVVYDAAKKQLLFMDNKADIVLKNSKLQLRFIIDRNSIEIYANQGEVTFTRFFYPDRDNKNLSLVSVGGIFTITSMELYKLESIWLKREQELGYKRETTE